MSDAAQPWSTDETAAPSPAAAKVADAHGTGLLDGDWSEGLAGATRAHGLPIPLHITPGAAPVMLPAPSRRSAEELVAEAAGRLPAEAMRTEQASAAALFTVSPERSAPILAEPSIQVSNFDAEATSVSVHVDAGLEAEPAGASAASAPASTRAPPTEPTSHFEPSSHAQPPTYVEPSSHLEPSGHAEPSGNAEPSGHAAHPEGQPSLNAEDAAQVAAPADDAGSIHVMPAAGSFEEAPGGRDSGFAAPPRERSAEVFPPLSALPDLPRLSASDPLAEQVAIDIRRALAAEDPANPQASKTPPDVWAALLQGSPPAAAVVSQPLPDTTQVSYPAPGYEAQAPQASEPYPEPIAAPAAAASAASPADLWAQSTAAAGPDVWAASAPPENAWAAGPEAAAGPDWGAVASSPADAWEPPLATPPLVVPFSEDTTLESQREAAAASNSEDDLPVAIPDPEPFPGRPAYLSGEPRVVVHTLAGRVKRGTLRSSDLGEAELRLKSPVGHEEKIAIGEVKAVFFMLSPGEQPPIQPGGRIRITLSDGRQLDGFRESDGPGGGVFIVPIDASRTNTRAIFVCGDAIQAVDQT